MDIKSPKFKELKLKIGILNEKVVIDFGTSVSNIQFGGPDALIVGKTITKHAKKLLKKNQAKRILHKGLK